MEQRHVVNHVLNEDENIEVFLAYASHLQELFNALIRRARNACGSFVFISKRSIRKFSINRLTAQLKGVSPKDGEIVSKVRRASTHEDFNSKYGARGKRGKRRNGVPVRMLRLSSHHVLSGEPVKVRFFLVVDLKGPALKLDE